MEEIKFNKEIYINKAKENWVVDRFRSEWNEYNCKTSHSIYSKNVKIIWIIAPWTWKKLPSNLLNKKKLFAQFIILMKINSIMKKKNFEKRQNN